MSTAHAVWQAMAALPFYVKLNTDWVPTVTDA